MPVNRNIALFVWLLATPFTLHAQQLIPMPPPHPERLAQLTIDVWSDVVCPFCYIGKRELDNALARFPHRDEVRVVWRSFELDPSAPDRDPLDMYDMLARKYGRTREQAKDMVKSVVDRAATLGLKYNMDIAVVGSSFHAHRLLQFAKTKGLGDAAKERLFKAYFCEGVHLADRQELLRLAKEVGLDHAEAKRVIESDAFTAEVRADEAEAQRLALRGVPFFVLDGRYGISGAQDSNVFLNALRKVWEERSTPAPR
ncbi:MAG: DsbA family oxidoreductase [Flavobacteriales bacterium]|nr:DsbA family oxidoreductase [Flavobacteriales bacterium]